MTSISFRAYLFVGSACFLCLSSCRVSETQAKASTRNLPEQPHEGGSQAQIVEVTSSLASISLHSFPSSALHPNLAKPSSCYHISPLVFYLCTEASHHGPNGSRNDHAAGRQRDATTIHDRGQRHRSIGSRSSPASSARCSTERHRKRNRRANSQQHQRR